MYLSFSVLFSAILYHVSNSKNCHIHPKFLIFQTKLRLWGERDGFQNYEMGQILWAIKKNMKNEKKIFPLKYAEIRTDEFHRNSSVSVYCWFSIASLRASFRVKYQLLQIFPIFSWMIILIGTLIPEIMARSISFASLTELMYQHQLQLSWIWNF